MEEEERSHTIELIRAYQKRLRVLEIQRARQGDDSPASIIVEIEEIKKQIDDLSYGINAINQDIKANANRTDGLSSKANAMRLTGELRYALELYRRIQQIDPDFPGIYAIIADI